MMLNDKMVKTQKAMDYIIYMMVGSYFTGTVCRSHMTEKRLFLFYKDISINTQYNLEEKCISYVENKLIQELPADIWKERVTVSMRPEDAQMHKTEVIFTGRGWQLKLHSECLSDSRVNISYVYRKIID